MNTPRSGFTLIEVVVAVAIYTGIMILVTFFGLDVSNFALQFQQDLAAKQELEIAIARMITEFRGMTPSENGSYALVAAGATSTVFYTDIGADGIIERVRYSIGTSSIEKGVIAPSGTPAQYPSASEIVVPALINVATGSFRYYDASYVVGGAPLAFPVDVGAVRTVRFSMTVDEQTSTRPVPQTASFVVTFRNLRE